MKTIYILFCETQFIRAFSTELAASKAKDWFTKIKPRLHFYIEEQTLFDNFKEEYEEL